MTFMFSSESILSVLGDPFNSKLLLEALSKDPEIDRLFSADAGVWEKYTIGQHTEMVITLFERFHAPYLNSEEKKFFRLFLALHDIGKPLAIEQTGDKSQQSKFTVPILRAVLELCGFPQKQVELAMELETHDLLGRYLKDQLSLEDTHKELKRISEKTKYSVQEVVKYLTIFYQCDAGAYTETAGGEYSLDYLFEFDNENEVMSFSRKLTKNTRFTERSPDQKFSLLRKLKE